jgi:hypothetical protein
MEQSKRPADFPVARKKVFFPFRWAALFLAAARGGGFYKYPLEAIAAV